MAATIGWQGRRQQDGVGSLAGAKTSASHRFRAGVAQCATLIAPYALL